MEVSISKFKLISMIKGRGISYEVTSRRMLLDLTDDKSILVKVMAWWWQAMLTQIYVDMYGITLATMSYNLQ